MKLKRKFLIMIKFNKLTAENFAERLAQLNLVTKADFDTKLIKVNKKINSNKTTHVLVEI